MKSVEKMLRLYAVTDRAWTGRRTLSEQTEEALRGGVTCVQLREKELGFEEFLEEAKAMKKLCEKYDVPLIINDNVEIALLSGADGVHVGQDDMAAQEVRKIAGDRLIVGVTAKTVEAAQGAQEAGADYLGSGAVFGSTTKKTRAITKDELRAICDSVSIPVVAIGGINRENLPLLHGTGIAGAAIVSGIFAKEDIESECKALRAMAEAIAER